MLQLKNFSINPLLLITLLLCVITTGCGGGHWDPASDTTTPTVTSTLPDDGDTDVAINATPTVTFSEPMNSTTINETTFTLTDPDGELVDGSVVYAGNTATFTPDANFEPSTTYTARVTTGAENTSGEPLANEIVWSFETAEQLITPTVLSTLPDDDAVDVPINTALTMTFSQAMNASTLNDANFTLIGLDNIEVQGEFEYTVIGNTLVFTPLLPLAIDSPYTATIKTGATDTLGETLASDYIWTFDTALAADLIAPEVELVSPNPSASGVCSNKGIEATFDSAVNPATVVSPAMNFTVMTTLEEVNVDGEVTLDPTNMTATFTPDAALTDKIEYTATITTDVEDLAGNNLVVAEIWTFTAGTTVCQQTIVLDKTSTYGVLSNTGVTLGGGPNSVTGFRVIGDVGIHPTGECVGCDTTTVDGSIAIGNVPAQDAMVELTAIYNEAIGRTTGVCTLNNSGSLVTNPSAACGGGADGIFTPGLYWSASSIAIPAGGTITLDAQNDADAVFIFQSESTIDTIGGDTHIILANQAQAKNVFWVAKSSATIGGTTSDFVGTVMAQSAITVNEGTEMEGRAFARTAAVTVQDNAVITVPAP